MKQQDTKTPSGIELLSPEGGKPVKMWTQGVPVEPEAKEQLEKLAQLPFVFHHVAVMPDVHVGKGSTIGSVIPTLGAVIPAAVGVDIGWSSDIRLKPQSCTRKSAKILANFKQAAP